MGKRTIFIPMSDSAAERLEHRYARRNRQRERVQQRTAKVLYDPANEQMVPLNVDGIIDYHDWRRDMYRGVR